MPVHFVSERSLKVRRLLREQDQAGALPAALSIFCDAKSRCQRSLTDFAAAVQLRLRARYFCRVANFDSEVPALTRRKLGAIPRRPTNSSAKCRVRNAESGSASSGLFWFSFRTPHSEFRVQNRIRGETIIILRFERRVCRWESCRMHHFDLRFRIYVFRFNGVWFAPNSRGAGLRNREPWRCNSSHADQFSEVDSQQLIVESRTNTRRACLPSTINPQLSTIQGMSTGQARRACLLNSACLRASGASPRHSAFGGRAPAPQSSQRSSRFHAPALPRAALGIATKI
jgi:hypothetical protein